MQVDPTHAAASVLACQANPIILCSKPVTVALMTEKDYNDAAESVELIPADIILAKRDTAIQEQRIRKTAFLSVRAGQLHTDFRTGIVSSDVVISQFAYRHLHQSNRKYIRITRGDPELCREKQLRKQCHKQSLTTEQHVASEPHLTIAQLQTAIGRCSAWQQHRWRRALRGKSRR